MDIEKLKQLCNGGNQVFLSLPWSVGTGPTVLLHRIHGPRGTVLGRHDGRTNALFRSDAVLRSIAKLESEGE